MRVSHGTLIALAAAVWYIGGLVLLWKGGERLILAAGSLGEGWALGAGALGMGIGLTQGRTLFRRSCLRNLRRIRSLKSPRAWQFFHPRFFLALAAMIGAAAILGVVAHRGPSWALGVAVVDWGVAFALLVSSEAFWSGGRRRDQAGRR
jgi:hypothetical protein